MRLEFAGQSARDADFTISNTSRLVNCYREPIASAGRAGAAIKSVLGLEIEATLASPFRALEDVDGLLYAVAGGGLYSVSSGVPTLRGSVADDANTAIAGNNGSVTITAGGSYYTWDGSTLATPAAGAFSAFGAHDYIGNYTVLTEAGGRRFQWSDLADPDNLPGLNFSTADGRDDNLIRPVAINGALYLFKETSHELWYLTGAAGASAFERQAGGVYDVGLKAYGLLAKVPGGAFMVGSDNRAHIVTGGLQPVSIPTVETAIAQGQPQACFVYEDEGHTFCVVTFADRPAWVYDIATGEWHERADGPFLAAWTVTCAAKSRGVWYAGRADNLLSFARVNVDGTDPLVREVTSRTLEIERQQFTVDMLEVFPRQGFASAQIELEVSRDGGITWSAPKAAVIGPVGAYGRRVLWRSLGRARQLTARLRVSQDVPFTMLADAEVTAR
jgi:hypothetical protein